MTDIDTTPAVRDEPDLLSAEQLQRLSAYGEPEEVVAGDIVYRAGDIVYDLVVVETGLVEVVRLATRDAAEAVIVRHGAGHFLGELNLLTGQTVYLTARVTQPGRIHRINPVRFRRVMAEEPDLADILLDTFRARRAALMESASRSIEVIGSDNSAP
ncbi:MAG: FAD-binding protein, partial [Glaciihabitans sp.]|nr:FAD-binding protein [Glaciihabitans sp.]